MVKAIWAVACLASVPVICLVVFNGCGMTKAQIQEFNKMDVGEGPRKVLRQLTELQKEPAGPRIQAPPPFVASNTTTGGTVFDPSVYPSRDITTSRAAGAAPEASEAGIPMGSPPMLVQTNTQEPISRYDPPTPPPEATRRPSSQPSAPPEKTPAPVIASSTTPVPAASPPPSAPSTQPARPMTTTAAPSAGPSNDLPAQDIRSGKAQVRAESKAPSTPLAVNYPPPSAPPKKTPAPVIASSEPPVPAANPPLKESSQPSAQPMSSSAAPVAGPSNNPPAQNVASARTQALPETAVPSASPAVNYPPPSAPPKKTPAPVIASSKPPAPAASPPPTELSLSSSQPMSSSAAQVNEPSNNPRKQINASVSMPIRGNQASAASPAKKASSVRLQAPLEDAGTGAGDYSGGPKYRIGAEDVLHIDVWGNTELTRDAMVRPDGMISLPLIQDIQAEGLTSAALADLIRQKLLAYVKDPVVSVIVKEVNATKVFILGYVTKPGTYPLRGELSVLQALSLAGGFTQFASPRKIRLVRNDGGEQEIRVINYYDLIDSGEGNYLLKPGDTIVVP
jgi:polysaccharide export outer membrane protein